MKVYTKQPHKHFRLALAAWLLLSHDGEIKSLVLRHDLDEGWAIATYVNETDGDALGSSSVEMIDVRAYAKAMEDAAAGKFDSHPTLEQEDARVVAIEAARITITETTVPAITDSTDKPAATTNDKEHQMDTNNKDELERRLENLPHKILVAMLLGVVEGLDESHKYVDINAMDGEYDINHFAALDTAIKDAESLKSESSFLAKIDVRRAIIFALYNSASESYYRCKDGKPFRSDEDQARYDRARLTKLLDAADGQAEDDQPAGLSL
jgi:hypothetical protein